MYICMNNTIYGTVYKELPPVGDKVLIADVSSCALSEPLDISKFGMVYFGAQKNVAPAGLVVAIIREDLLGNARDITPVMMNYKIQADADSVGIAVIGKNNAVERTISAGHNSYFSNSVRCIVLGNRKDPEKTHEKNYDRSDVFCDMLYSRFNGVAVGNYQYIRGNRNADCISGGL